MSDEFDREAFTRAHSALQRLVNQFTYEGSVCPNDDEREEYEEIGRQGDEAALEVLKTIPVPAIAEGYAKRFANTRMVDFDEELAERARYLRQWLADIELHAPTFFPQRGPSVTHKIDANTQPRIADVVLVTVNEIESKAVYDTFASITGTSAIPKTISDRVYHDLGTINGIRVYQALSGMGSSGLGAAQQTVEKAIAALRPRAIIAVGIAFGIDEGKQEIGDILVSEQLLLYESQRVGTMPATLPPWLATIIAAACKVFQIHMEGHIITRGDKPRAPNILENFFRTFTHASWTGATVRFGVLLSGEKLVDNVDYRNHLKQFAPECIGGEMEGAGAYVASQDKKVDWIVIKGICDWADGNKGTDKTKRQTLAATNAITFVAKALQYAKLPTETTAIQPAAIPSSIVQKKSRLMMSWRTGGTVSNEGRVTGYHVVFVVSNEGDVPARSYQAELKPRAPLPPGTWYRENEQLCDRLQTGTTNEKGQMLFRFVSLAGQVIVPGRSVDVATYLITDISGIQELSFDCYMYAEDGTEQHVLTFSIEEIGASS